jgi:hypothetical protein
MNNPKDQRDLTLYVWLLGALVAICFASSIYLGLILIDIQSDLIRLARDFPGEKEEEILNKTATLSGRIEIIKHSIAGVALFLVLPFGWLMRLRYFEKKPDERLTLPDCNEKQL